MNRDLLIKTGVVFATVLSISFFSCKKEDNPAAPAGIDFHITSPKNGDTLAWGQQFTLRWTLPADSSIDTVVVYRKPQGQQFWEALNLYFPVESPIDSLGLNIGSDVPAGQTEKFRIQNKVDSTQFSEITINIKG
jgi:hypothetical protein